MDWIERGKLTPEQCAVVERPLHGGDSLFVLGPIGAGKTTALWHRLLYLLNASVRGESILYLVPDRGVRDEMYAGLHRSAARPHGRPTVVTFYGLARQMVDLFWPAVAESAGFAHPPREPLFLTYETSQFLMHQVVEPLLAQGYFDGLRVRPRRLTSQLLDNLNKAAINGFPHTEIGERLTRAHPGAERARYFQQAQECANRFRRLCLARNALDVSLVVEVFHRHLLQHPLFWAYFSRQFRHVLVDNLEETIPVEQDLLRRLLAGCDSATLAYDEGGGYRILLGIDPDGARMLQEECRAGMVLADRFVPQPALLTFSHWVQRALGEEGSGEASSPSAEAGVPPVHLTVCDYRSDMIAEMATRIAALVEEGVRPAQIAIICPYADGVLRFGLEEALRRQGVPFNLMRRWFSLRDDAVVRGLLTWSALAHPKWGIAPSPRQLAEALHILIPDMDLSRAALLAEEVLRTGEPALAAEEDIGRAARERVGFASTARYGFIQRWLSAYQGSPPMALDRFLGRFFDEVICGGDLWPRQWTDAYRACARLIESARKFRQAAPAFGIEDAESVEAALAYVEMIQQGIVAARYVEPGEDDTSVLLVTPAYAYLLENRSSDFQFWVDVGSSDWWRPPRQPLTNPIVLSRRWQAGNTWDVEMDVLLRDRLLSRMVDGLVRRCRRALYLFSSTVSTLGYPQEGPLLSAVQQALMEEGA